MNAWLKSVPCKNKDVGLKVTMLEEIGDGPKGALCNEMGPCGNGQPSWDIP
jgi:hypothetical protein